MTTHNRPGHIQKKEQQKCSVSCKENKKKKISQTDYNCLSQL